MQNERGPRSNVTLWIWSPVALSVALAGLTVVLAVAAEDSAALFMTAVIVLPITGAIILTKRSGNNVGRLMLWAGGISIASGALGAYARFAATRADWPLAAWAAWLSSATSWAPLEAYLILLLLIFPTGSLLSPRWRSVAVLGTLYLTGLVVQTTLQPGGIEDYTGYPQLTNPVGVAAVDRVSGYLPIFDLLLLVTIVLAAASAFLRFHRARGIERQQMKWFAFTAVVIVVLLIPLALADPLLPDHLSTGVETVSIYIAALAIVIGLPLTIAIAVLRYHLYDIDWIVNRAIVYSLLSVGLFAAYFTIVLGLGGLVRPATGESSPVVVAVSTLAVAGLFRPLRARIQTVVDRRFYRHRYDAERTLDAFSTRLRDELDLDTLTGELRHIIEDTMQPVGMSVWLRPRISPQAPDLAERRQRSSSV